MPLAQVLQFDHRQQIGRRRPTTGTKCVIVQLFRASPDRAHASDQPMAAPDEDRFVGRGRDPG